MKKIKTKPKTAPKEASRNSVQGKVVKIKSGKARPGLTTKVSAVRQYWGHTKDFLAESVQEMKKTTWPNRKETLTTTAVVLVLVFLLASYLGFVDYLLSHFVRYFIH